MESDSSRFHQIGEFDTNLNVSHAYELLSQIVENHKICVSALRIVSESQPLVDQLTAAYKTSFGFDSKQPGYASNLEKKIAYARYVVDKDFFVLRNSTLIALCGALEGFIKTVAAARIIANKQVQEKLSQKRLSVRFENLLDDKYEERVMAAVDNLLEDKKGPVKGKAIQFLSLLAEVKLDCPDAGKEAETLNQAYILRNQIAHVGHLSGAVGEESRSISEEKLREIISALERFASDIYWRGGYTGL